MTGLILELDQGNTRGKWRLVRSTEGGPVDIIARGVFAPGSWWQRELPASWRQNRPLRIRCSNVAGAQVGAAIDGRLRTALGIPVEFARVTPQSAGVCCGYADVSRLGVDRWLAVLAAHGRATAPALIMDCGSAVTLDLLGHEGQHLGGYIVPGLGLMRRALFSDTDAVKVPESFAEGMSLAPGRHTDDAVNRGLPLMVLGAMERAQEVLRNQLQSQTKPGEPRPREPLRTLVTGGDGALIASLCRHPVELVEDLVMEGLSYATVAALD
ncbi:type III pantothenate kinase [Microbulbifer elongatus]|uniref:Type III pantothenate kinase n=1 Tax=Microbulbifer elongatus TaxID=86173 RepID=A0ABT1P1Z7_9GAMM|nr:type III pantothenate kinase [Microbulbifer elongatus]MCQ3830152.1 type III pantothenate kinase [Microbulbifer elongatus]